MMEPGSNDKAHRSPHPRRFNILAVCAYNRLIDPDLMAVGPP